MYKMVLEEMLMPLKKVDEEIHRTSMHLTRNWNDRKVGAIGLGLNFFGSNFASFGMYSNIGPALSYIIINGPAGGLALKKINELEESTSEKTINYHNYGYIKFNRFIRLPFLIGGIGCLIESVCSLFSGQTPDYSSLMLGIGMISNSSAMYLVDRDPKLLEKKPFWNRVYNSIHDRLTEPVRIPQPSHVGIRYSIENVVEGSQ